jgi:hypothetical protein
MQNPALMRPGLHNQVSLNNNFFYSGIDIMNLQYGWNAPKLNTAFFGGVQYLNYGSFAQTDEFGNQNGNFHAVDYAITLGASRTYLDNWRYGADIKYARSVLYNYTASAALIDIGINYYDTASGVDIGAVAKNMGAMITRYNPSNMAEPMPFDLQLGISKRFKHLPLRVFATIHHLYEWDIRYDNPADATTNSLVSTNDTATKSKSNNVGDIIFRHFILGAELTLGNRLTATVSYNDLRRRELALTTKPGVAGMAFGLALHLNKFQIHYARTFYHITGAYNELGLNMDLSKMFGLGQTGEKIGWNKTYPDW